MRRLLRKRVTIGDDSKKGSILAQIVVGVVVSLAVAGTAPFWWVPVRKFIFPPAQLIPQNMVGVWTGEVRNVPENGGSTHPCYALHSNGSIDVQDDKHYGHHPQPYSGIKAIGDTISFKLMVEGGTYANPCVLKLKSPDIFGVSIFKEREGGELLQEGTLKRSDQKTCPQN